jgi:predicted GNAT family acetyltransferase
MSTVKTTPVYSILGPKILVDLFVPVWSKLTGAISKYDKPIVSYKLLSCCVGEGPPPMSLSEGFTVRLANKDDDYRALASLFQSFSKTTSYPIDSYSAQSLTRLSVEQHRVWIFVNTSQTLPGLSLIAGYLLLARETPRSVSISQLYTGRDYRGRGVGEALVRKCVLSF